MRDAVIVQIDENKEVVITTDGCTGIGSLEKDVFNIPSEIISSITTRVALMELVTLRAIPIAYSFNHISDNALFNETLRGTIKAFEEFKFYEIPYVASSEKNFQVSQTSITISITGIRLKQTVKTHTNLSYVVIGEPLFGKEVLEFPDKMITPKEVYDLLDCNYVYEVIPCGSGGVFGELKNYGVIDATSRIDLNKSAGPASCVLVIVHPARVEELKLKYLHKFSEVVVSKYE